jgi:hypothetical protein
MKALRTARLLFFSISVLLLITWAHLSGSELNKLTFFTFSAPVEIPGGKVLPAGTYAFKVLDTNGNRDIVQILNGDQTRVYATVITIPNYRPNPTDKAIVEFAETPSGGPAAIKEWFYPGDTAGWEFVYPKNRAVELAKAAKQPVPSMPQQMTSEITQQTQPTSSDQASAGGHSKQSNVQALMNAPLKAEEANGQEDDVSKAFDTHPSSKGDTPQSQEQR